MMEIKAHLNIGFFQMMNETVKNKVNTNIKCHKLMIGLWLKLIVENALNIHKYGLSKKKTGDETLGPVFNAECQL